MSKFVYVLCLSLILMVSSFINKPLQAAFFDEHEKSAMLDFDPEKAFLPSDDALKDVDGAISRALKNNTLALVVMGANWCHDSRGLADHFTDPKMSKVLEDSYELLFVDVGFLETGSEIISRFGMPVIYGTPTVLIIDPKTEKLINGHDMHQWRDAFSISIEDTVSYFKAMAEPEARVVKDQGKISADLQRLLDEINEFEKTQSIQLYKGFEKISPMLAMGRDNFPEEFADIWNEVKEYRYKITGDLATLRAYAIEQTRAGEKNIVLDYPEYDAFSWE